MNLDEFAASYPELHGMLNGDIEDLIAKYEITGEESIKDLDNLIEGIAEKYESNNFFGYDTELALAQQIGYGRRNWNDGYRDRYDRYPYDRRGNRNFDTRDVLRLLLLRQLFDGNRRRFY